MTTRRRDRSAQELAELGEVGKVTRVVHERAELPGVGIEQPTELGDGAIQRVLDRAAGEPELGGDVDQRCAPEVVAGDDERVAKRATPPLLAVVRVGMDHVVAQPLEQTATHLVSAQASDQPIGIVVGADQCGQGFVVGQATSPRLVSPQPSPGLLYAMAGHAVDVACEVQLGNVDHLGAELVQHPFERVLNDGVVLLRGPRQHPETRPFGGVDQMIGLHCKQRRGVGAGIPAGRGFHRQKSPVSWPALRVK